MGRIADVLDFERTQEDDAHVSEVKCDPGGGANVTARHFGAPGEDSHPLPGDVVAIVDSVESGSEQVAGYIDPHNEPEAEPGEVRRYARDGDGAVAIVLWLKSDGTMELGSPDDFVAMASKVDKRIGDLEQAFNDFVNTAFNAHTHVAPMGGTSPPNPTGSPATPGDPTGSETIKVQS
jgi:hypothetical protein